MKTNIKRKDFIRTCGLTAAALTLPDSKYFGKSSELNSSKKLKLGLASYTTRALSLDETIKLTKQLGLKHIGLKDKFHLPIGSPIEILKKNAKKIRDAGLDFYGGGVFYMKTKEEVEKTFEYAKNTGIRTIIGVPGKDLLELVNEKIIKYDVEVAIHNHGPEDKVYPTCESAYELIKDLDPRFGLCNDIGHTQRCGISPAEDIIKYADRLLDIHLKDVSIAEADGKTVEIGRGVIDIPAVIKAVQKINYDKILSFEFEKDKDNPLPGLAESVGYIRGVIDTF